MNIQHSSHCHDDIRHLEGKVWKERISDYLDAIQRGTPQKLATQEMQKAIKARGLFDYVSYKTAISKIFPPQDFNLEARIAGTPQKTPKGEYIFTAKWYEFVVKQRSDHLPTGPEEAQKCVIKIHAPGSRALTSDVDTSILTTFEGDSFFFEKAVKIAKGEGIDFAGRVTNRVIKGFYKFSEREFGITSSIHRDSNAYTDTLAKDEENYPKFHEHEEENNPLVLTKRLFSPKKFNNFFKEHKYNKHVQEMAASLFSLRDSLEEGEWQKFKEQAKEELKDILEIQLLRRLPEQQHDVLISACQQDYDNIFQRIEKLYEHHCEELKNKRDALENKERGKEPLGLSAKLLNPEEKEEDIKIAALNRLYFEYLEKCTECYEKILALKSKKKPLKVALEAKKSELVKELGALEKLDETSTHPIIQEVVKNLQINCAAYKEDYKDLKKSLRENILKTARQQVKHHYAQILASTFAYEAYVCRSAVYHVVNGQKGFENLHISKQTLLGSALQQAGFKLLHTKQVVDEDGSSAEKIAYNTAKYGQRLFNLIFSGHKEALDRKDIKLLARGMIIEGLPKFTYLRSEQIGHNAYPTFGEKELTLINTQAKIIQHIKSNSGISDGDKFKKTRELLQSEGIKLNFEEEKSLYLSTCTKLIGLVYAARLKKKGYLWGQDPNTPLLNKVEEKKETESSVPLSNLKTLQAPKAPESSEEESYTDEEEEVSSRREGVAKDIGRHQKGKSKSEVRGEKRAEARDAKQEDDSVALVIAGSYEKRKRQQSKRKTAN
ncbi:hypothetical protein [Parachlamydia sp. AcF125]|uniref:hypothetical protein n=1 Tax=Parachlamydia sp. AcF125 TaxID=2795736 RepID=UPI001BCA4C30|nr:hypothetical protein [Parachlamydia sp. AcF125]MBS4168472.1 hypothetical protein [Parachlamydia sp. AcF125]